ncbi:MAG: matrixin family metalloprotease [Fimbriimonadales bacterium]|nr:matrixin family metalloprotease [Fimbriimonadales bacterium]
MWKRIYFGLTFTVALLLVGCGGGTQSGEQRVCSADTFKPNYVPQLERLLYWERFPVTVGFERDAHYSDYYRTLALQGFNQWVEATGNVVRYQVVDNPDAAQIRVSFKPNTRNGLTTYTYYPSSGRLVSAKVEIGVQGNNPVDIRSVAAHEFGHAIGIAGHSTDPNDMMYPNFTSNVALKVTPSDLNTVKTAYCNYFLKPSRAAPRPTDETPVEATIVCGHSH